MFNNQKLLMVMFLLFWAVLVHKLSMVFIFKLNIKVVYHLFFFFAVKKKKQTRQWGEMRVVKKF